MSRVSSANKEKTIVKDNLILDEVDQKDFQHTWWKIFLIVFSTVAFIITCIFNALASTAPNGVFKQPTGNISDQNTTDFTPAGWTFSIWGVIYFWQAAWLIYAITRIFRKSKSGYLYLTPNTLHYSVFVSYIINMGLNIGWLIVWDRQTFGWALLVIFLMLVTAVFPMIVTHILLQRNRQAYINSQRKIDIWLVRILVHNGLAVYATWLYLATLLNLTVWVSQIYNKDTVSVSNASTAALSLVLVGIVAYFVSENFIFYTSMAYTFLPWFVLIFGLSGVVSKNYKRTDIPDRNKQFALALLIISSILFVVRLIIFIIRYITKRIPTIQDP